MTYIYSLKTIAFLLIAVVLFNSCDTTNSSGLELDENETIAINGLSLTYTRSGGAIGGLIKKMVLDSTGVVILPDRYPELRQQLTQDAYEKLAKNFEDFVDNSQSIPDSAVSTCSDDVLVEIEWKYKNESNKFRTIGCLLYNYNSVDSSTIAVRSFIDILDTIYGNVYETQIPWKGLTSEFSIESDTYALGESIKMIYKIHNPTTKERGLYFRGKEQTYFTIYRENVPNFYYRYPDYKVSDMGEPSEILFAPGETKIIETEWNQIMETKDGDIPLDIGRYRINIHMSAGGLRQGGGNVDIVDPSIPVFAQVSSRNNDNSSNPTYTFNLLVKNWSEEPVKLNFPSSQKIGVTLYGNEHKNSISYESSLIDDTMESTVTILPGEETVFSHTVDKSEIANLSNWRYVEIELMCTNFESISTGFLEMYKYRPD